MTQTHPINEDNCETALERNARISSSLRDTLAVLNSNRELGEILDFIVSQAKELTDADAVAIYTPAAQRNVLQIEASNGLSEDYIDAAIIPMGLFATGYAIQARQPAFIADISKPSERVTLPLDEEQALIVQKFAQHFRAILAVPLIFPHGELYGTLDLYFREPRDFTEEEINLAKAYADQTTLAIDNARLRARAKKTAVLAERDRLARDLHDAVTQELFSLSLVADVLPALWQNDPATGMQALDEIKLLARVALDEMRALLLELKPSVLLNADLDQLIRQLCDSFEGRTRMPVNFEYREIDCMIPADIKVAFYRIVQEALHNVQKHAQASSVSIFLGRLDPAQTPHAELPALEAKRTCRIYLSIKDNGIGFDAQNISSERFGLKIMRERADSINAYLNFNTQIGHGTHIELIW